MKKALRQKVLKNIIKQAELDKEIDDAILAASQEPDSQNAEDSNGSDFAHKLFMQLLNNIKITTLDD